MNFTCNAFHIKDDIEKEEKPKFFVPDQFVKRKLRMKYEGLVSKVRHMDLTIKRNQESMISDRMLRL